MKKRLLALCLAAALLLGMMPALTLSTNALDDGDVQDKLITNANGDYVSANFSELSTVDTTNYPYSSGYSAYLGTNGSTAASCWGRYNVNGSLEVDHSMDITFEMELQSNLFEKIGEKTKLTATETGAKSVEGNIWLFTLNDSDGETGGFVYPFIYRDDNGIWLQFLMPSSTYGNPVYSEPIDLGLGDNPNSNTDKGFDARMRLKLVWSADGSVEVYSAHGAFSTSYTVAQTGSLYFKFEDYALVGDVKAATWTRNTNATLGNIDNPETQGANTSKENIDGGAADFFELCVYNAAKTSGTGMYAYSAKLTHNTYVTPQVEGSFTPEDLSTGSESWGFAPFTYLMNSTDSVAALATDNNTVYVAVKGADGSATVTLGSAEQTVSIVDGMGVVKFENVGLVKYGDSRTIKVATSTGSLETNVVFNATEVKLNYTKTNTVDLWANSTYHSSGTVNKYSTFLYYQKGLFQYSEKSGSYGDVVIDRSKDVTISLPFYFAAESFAAGMDILSAGTNNAFTWGADAATDNYLLFAPYDSATKTHFLAYFTADESYNVYLRFFLNDKTNTTDVPMGVSVASADADLRSLQLVWHTNGDITVMLNGVAKQTVSGATWDTVTTHQSYTDSPGTSGMNLAYDYYHVRTERTSAKYGAELYGLSFSTPEEGGIVAIDSVIKSYNVTLGSDVGMNFNLNDVDDATVTVTHKGNTDTYETNSLTSDTIRLDLAAAQMADDITVTTEDAYGMTTTVTTSVEDYAAAALAEATDDNVKNMINAMLNYGYSAKAYFKYDIDNAMAAVTAPSLGNLTDVTESYAAVVDGALEGITAKAATMRLEDVLKLRFYFSGDITGHTVTSGEAVYDASTGLSHVDIEVAPKNMDEMYTVTVSNGTDTLSVQYGCMTYMTKYAADTDLAALMQAMYTYSLAAESYPET